MSNYEPIVPVTNPFNFHGASIEIETDNARGEKWNRLLY